VFRIQHFSVVFTARVTMLERAIAKGRSVCLSVTLVIHALVSGANYGIFILRLYMYLQKNI